MNLVIGDVIDWARHNLGVLLVGSMTAYAFLFVLIVLLFARQNRIVKKQTVTVLAAQRTIDQALQENARNAESLRNCLQNVGVVRYDALGDEGGEHSFSVALLDAQSSGILITSLHGQQNMRLYTKSVIAEQSPQIPLTDEEKQAVALAMASKKP